METKERQWWVIGARLIVVFECWGQPVQISRCQVWKHLGGVRAGGDHPRDFPGLPSERLWRYFWAARTVASPKVVYARAVVVISLKFISSCPTLAHRVWGERRVLVLRDFKSERWEKIGNISLEDCSQILEEREDFRIQLNTTTKIINSTRI